MLEKCLSDKSEYPSLRQKLSDMLNIGNTHINSASTSTGIGLANAMVGLMALSGLLGRGEEPRNDETNCDPCDSARLHAPVSQILDPPLPNSDLGGERAPRVPRERALHTASERTVPGKYGKNEIFSSACMHACSCVCTCVVCLFVMCLYLSCFVCFFCVIWLCCMYAGLVVCSVVACVFFVCV